MCSESCSHYEWTHQISFCSDCVGLQFLAFILQLCNVPCQTVHSNRNKAQHSGIAHLLVEAWHGSRYLDCFAGSSSHLNISFMFLQWRSQENEGQSPIVSLWCVMFGICHFGICHVLYSWKFTYVSRLIGTRPRWLGCSRYLSHLPLLGIHLALSSGSVHKSLPSRSLGLLHMFILVLSQGLGVMRHFSL